MSENNSKTGIKNIILAFLRYLFLAGYFLFAVFTVLEIIKPRIITSFINMNIFLLLLAILGLIVINYYQPGEREIIKLNFLDKSAIFLASLLLAIFITYFTRQIGYLAILVGLAGLVISYYFIDSSYKEKI
jgi:hypothetical protein